MASELQAQGPGPPLPGCALPSFSSRRQPSCVPNPRRPCGQSRERSLASVAPLCLLPRHGGKESGGPGQRWAASCPPSPSVGGLSPPLPGLSLATGPWMVTPSQPHPGRRRGWAGSPCAESGAAAPDRGPSLGWGDAAPGGGRCPGHHSLLWLSPGDPQRSRPGGCRVGCGQRAQACPPSLGPAVHHAPPRGGGASRPTSPGRLQRSTATADLPPPLREKQLL